MNQNRYELNVQLAQMLKGGVIMDVTNAKQAKIAGRGGSHCGKWRWSAFPLISARKEVWRRMSDPAMITE